MNMPAHPLSRIGCAFVIAFAATTASAVSPADERMYDAMIETSANACSHYVGKTGAPAIKSMKSVTMSVLQRRRVVLCPDTRLDAQVAVVWYGQCRVMAWNPEVGGATDAVRNTLERMAIDDAFSLPTRVWSAEGKEISGATIPELLTRGPEVGCWRR
jgi:hypothetical protein